MDPSESDRNPVDELAEEFVGRYRRGERPTPEEYAARHPQWADRIRALFPALVAMEHARPGPGEAAWPSPGPAAGRPEQLGDYRIIGEVGRGGMGVVYEAEQESLGRHVALKVLPAHALLDPRPLQRFKREARAAARLHHTNIVPVHGVGEQDGLHYFVMQFIRGQSLDQVLAELRRLRRGRHPTDPEPARSREGSAAAVARSLLSGQFEANSPGGGAADGSAVTPVGTGGTPASVHLPGQAEGSSLSESGWRYWHGVARVGLQVAGALAYASSQGILHRDIKPSNLLLDTRGTVWVTDFGLAKLETDGDDVTHTGDIVGTLRYMAPERLQGTADVRSDVYALGLTLYELLTLRPAFDETNRNKLVARVMTDEPARPRALAPEVPRDLETIVLKATAREPDRRYQTPAELAEDLQRFLDDRPIKARRLGPVRRVWRWCRRNPALAGFAAGLAAALLAGLVGTTWGLVRAEVARQHAVIAQRAEERRAEAEAQAKQEAEVREAETKAVLDFVQNKIIAAARPKDEEGGLDRDVPLREALDAALKHVEQSFADRPLIEAQLRLTLGTSYWYLGEYKVAAEQYERAHALYARHRGPARQDTIRSTHNVAMGYAATGRRPEAVKLYEDTLVSLRATLGPGHHRTLLTASNLADSYYAARRHAESLKLNEETQALLTATLGPDHPDTLMSANNTANGYAANGRLPDALRLHQETLPRMKAVRGPDHTDTLSSMTSLANTLGALDRHQEALELREEVVVRREGKLGRNHPETLKSMNNLAHSYAALGRHQEALKLREETLTLRKAKLGPDNPFTLQSMHSVASSLVKLGRGAEAVPLIDECVRRAAGKAVDPRVIPWAMDLRLRHFEASKDAAGCRATAEMWERLHRTDAASLYDAARMRAVTAGVLLLPKDPGAEAARRAREESDRAVDWLRKAIDAGYTNGAGTRQDKDLEVLRHREDFQKLLTELERRSQVAPK